MPQFYKTKKCPWFAVGRCRMDKDCNWAHSIDELRPSVDLTRTKLCDIQLREGMCRNPQCRYAHSRKELRATSDLFKTSLCVYWVKGSCAIGESCRYAHGLEELRSRPQKGEFIPLDVETLPAPIQRNFDNDLQVNFGRSIFHEDRLYRPYNAISTTANFSSGNNYGYGTVEGVYEPISSFVANLFSNEDNANQQFYEECSWPTDRYQLTNQFTPLSLLDIPLVWREKSYGHNNFYEPLCNASFESDNVSQFQNKVFIDNQVMGIQRNQMNNKRHHNNDFERHMEPEQMSKRSYPECIEEMYSYTPSTASSIREKISLQNLEVS
ncbi:zinc finger (CCCH type) motif-containing protein [Cryptosporidium felis]|nr:zinc finger (CCCH type) motif-containing protein [Cryptosporidium felis]